MKTSRSKRYYGLTLAKAVKHFDLTLTEDDDLTLVAVQGLVMTYLALSTFNAHFYLSIFELLERVWRAVLVLRAKEPADKLDESVFTRFGRFRGVVHIDRGEIVETEEDLVVEDVNRPIYRPKVRKRRRKIRGK